MNDTPTAAPMRGDVTSGDRFQHLKRGTEYEVLGLAELQMACDVVDGSALVVYRGDDGRIWAREEGEFLDGRFVRLAHPASAAAGDGSGRLQAVWDAQPDLPPIEFTPAEEAAIYAAFQAASTSDVAFGSRHATLEARVSPAGAADGYASAFYEIATMLGIGAQAASPVDVWRDQMRPKLEALTARTDAAGTVDRTVLAKLLNEAAGPRRIAGEDDAPLFADSKPEVQEYWLEIADVAITAVAGEGVNHG